MFGELCFSNSISSFNEYADSDFYLSHIMKNPGFSICENKDSFCFRYIHNTTHLLSEYKLNPPTILCGCTAWIVLDLVRNPKARFSPDIYYL